MSPTATSQQLPAPDKTLHCPSTRPAPSTLLHRTPGESSLQVAPLVRLEPQAEEEAAWSPGPAPASGAAAPAEAEAGPAVAPAPGSGWRGLAGLGLAGMAEAAKPAEAWGLKAAGRGPARPAAAR